MWKLKSCGVQAVMPGSALLAALGCSAWLAGCGALPLEETFLRPQTSHPEAIVQPKKPPQRGALAELQRAHSADPANPDAALRFARALRGTGQKMQALAVLESVKTSTPALSMELGLLALDLGQGAKAEAALLRALDPKKPDWRILNGLGSAQASLGRPADGIVHLRKAHELHPGAISIMNNLALALILDRRVEEGEKILRRAAATANAQPRVKQNLALALGLKGQHQEAVKIASTASITEVEARSNVAFLKGLTEGKTPVKRAASLEPSAARHASLAEVRPTVGK